MSTSIRHTSHNTFIVYEEDDGFEYEEFPTRRAAEDFIAEMDRWEEEWNNEQDTGEVDTEGDF